MVLLLTGQGQKERIAESYIANSWGFKDVVGRQIAEAAKTLPPDVVAAAEARGRSWDLWATAAECLAELGRLVTG